MSGGSWNYLYSKDIEELMNDSTIELLQDMSDRLVALGYTDVAQDTQRLTEYIKSANIRIETLFEMLSPIFKAVEWFDSGDWGEETLNNEVLKYRKSNFDSYSKAIDDFVELYKSKTAMENELVDKIAEQLKGAKQND